MEDQVDQSEQTSDTSVAEESVSQAEPSEVPEQKAQADVNKEDKLPPFHEHPRFKEVIEQNRGYKSEMEQYKEALNAMQRELQVMKQQATPKKEEAVDPFLADLAKVNPEYARSLQSVYDRAAKADEIAARLDKYEQREFATQAHNHFNKLLETNKVSDQLEQELYRATVRTAVIDMEQSGKTLGLKDLDKLFNEFHSRYSKAMEERNRKLTASYVKDKTKDTTPKGTTGGAATAPVAKKMAAGDIGAQAKWLADQIRSMKKTIWLT